MASEIVTGGGSTTFLSIIGGRLKQKVDEATEGAKIRTYEDKEGNEGSKWELTHKNVSGMLVGFGLDKKDFGVTMLEIVVVDSDGLKTQIGTPDSSRYAIDFMEKLPNIDLTKEIVLNSYDFEAKNPKTGKVSRKTGFSIVQDGEKIGTAYFDFDTKKNLRGMPEVDQTEAADYDSDDWKVYYLQKKKFLVKETTKLFNKFLQSLDVEAEQVKPSKEKATKKVDDEVPF